MTTASQPPRAPKPLRKKKSDQRDPRRVVMGFVLISLLSLLVVAGLGAATLWHFSHDLPKIITPEDYRPLTVTQVLSHPAGKNGAAAPEAEVLGEFFKQRRYIVPYEKFPEVVVKAFISAEDDKFFEHPGINIMSLVRAAIANFRAGRVVQGGSTITQQVAKSFLYGNTLAERSFSRKIRELILTYRIEKNLNKKQILYLYLNQIYLGHGAYGAQSAARTYFRKDVGAISVAEAALMAGMNQAPGKYSPLLNPKRAKERQLYVLKRMLENGYITQAQYTEASAQPLRIFHDEDLNTQYAGYLVEHIRRYLVETYGEKAVYEDGLTVTVPTSRELSLAAHRSVRDGLEAVDKRIGYRGPIQQLTSNEEIEKFLKDLRLSLIERRVHFLMFMPDGHMDPEQAMKSANVNSEAQLLVTGEHYQAVVTSLDEKRKSIGVLIGGVKGEIPFSRMSWARRIKDEKTGERPREPKNVGDVVARGDVVWAKVLENSEKGLTLGLSQEPQVQGALFSIEASTGYVLAMEGGYNFDASEFNRATQAQRQPGSSFKPLIYSAALEKGFTPATIIVDSPIVYEDTESGKWKPANFEEKFYGDTTFRQALIKSRNVPTIKILQAIQVPYVIDYVKRLGMSAKFNNDLSISLGSTAMSLLEMTKVYAVFARLGRRVNPIFITQVRDRDGKVLEEQAPQVLPAVVKIPPLEEPADGEPVATASPAAPINESARRAPFHLPKYPPADDPDQILDPRVAFVMTHLMSEVVSYGTGHEAKNLGRPAAGKTGTTSDYIDALFIGYTPHVVTGSWVGFDNQKPIGPGETGARAALPIWLGYMKDAVKGYPETDFVVPPQVVFTSIDAATGKLAPANSSTAIREAFIEGTQPTEVVEPGRAKPASQGDFFKEDTE
jgi:penicillin-binding protein 1A